MGYRSYSITMKIITMWLTANDVCGECKLSTYLVLCMATEACGAMAKGHDSCNARVPETPRQTIYRNIFERSRLLSPVVACARFGSGHVEHNALPQSVWPMRQELYFLGGASVPWQRRDVLHRPRRDAARAHQGRAGHALL